MKILETWGLGGIGGKRPAPPISRAAAVITALLAPVPAAATDGFYVGGHVGYLFGNATATLGDPVGQATAGGSSSIGQLFGGVQAGYQTTLAASRWRVGLELDLSFMDTRDFARVLSTRSTPTATADEQLEYLGTIRGRLGYSFGDWTPFVTGGLAFASTRWGRIDHNTGNEDATPGQWRMGWVVGGGVDYALDKRWTARLEYLYTQLGLT
ncbi:MAG TPA: outer membrane beta-barrel protein, partial [Reyranella sp.]|nr:outer membrane beta-barrel protein [Reyranella sp.]